MALRTDTERRLTDALGPHVGPHDTPGLVAILASGEDVAVVTLGVRELDGAPVTRDTVFRLSSMTKPMVAVAALALVEDGVLALEQPVDRWLPELADRRVLRDVEGPVDDTVPATRAITVHDLLAFTMGFGHLMRAPGSLPILRAAEELGVAPGPPHPAAMPPPDDYVAGLGALPLMHQPGERWLYETGSEVLGVLLARAAGTSLGALLRERVFDPLGLHDTAFDASAMRDRFTVSYMDGEAALAVYDPVDGEWSAPPVFESGGAGLVGTADDYLAFARMLLRGGAHPGGRILGEPSVQAMTSDALSAAQKAHGALVPGWFDAHSWGLGVAVVTADEDPMEPVGRYGWDGGLGSSWANDPARDLAGVLLTNRVWSGPSWPAATRAFWTVAAECVVH